MKILSFHPVDMGNIPPFVQFTTFGPFLGLDMGTIQANWRARYPFIERRKKGGLWIDVKEADLYMDSYGLPLFSERLLIEKRRSNPGWRPSEVAPFSIEPLDGSLDEIIGRLAALVAQKLHQESTGFFHAGGAA